ncbi:hypothetical protein [Halorussus sp. MSC15.2]|uniref:hypothetical protein n=1 Tax=Halorussus sp. MSC15.2 TaxID=2283638 RepID=UPI0013D072E8|nr:hypothetical protein [Halorussus sp. MSC15.2]NEU56742.1 hypothetical protein [Halorussus sp. MSC15.2]
MASTDVEFALVLLQVIALLFPVIAILLQAYRKIGIYKEDRSVVLPFHPEYGIWLAGGFLAVAGVADIVFLIRTIDKTSILLFLSAGMVLLVLIGLGVSAASITSRQIDELFEESIPDEE